MSARTIRSAFVAAILITTAGGSATLLATSPSPVISQQAERPDWSKRLTALVPQRPIDYFELGEEVADAAATPEERELARTLFGLAGTLSPELLGRSAALAQAALASDARQRRTLEALASLLDPAADGARMSAAESTVDVEHAVALSEAFSHLRRGQGARALSVLRAPEVTALLERYGTALPGGPERFREDCRAFRSNIPPAFPAAQLLLMLRLEEAFLSHAGGTRESGASAGAGEGGLVWSSSLIATGAAPLLEVDTAKLEIAFGVDPTRALWRKGQWVRASAEGG